MQPSLDTQSRRLRDQRVVDKCYQILRENRVVMSTPRGNVTFTTPSRTHGDGNSHLDYGGKQWLWDSAAHVMILAHTEPEVAKAELRAVFKHQNLRRETADFGFVPHMNYFHGDGSDVPHWARPHFHRFLNSEEGRSSVAEAEREEFHSTYWSNPSHSDITQPPILAMAALEILSATDDLPYCREIVPNLAAYYDYLHERRADTDGLLRIIHPWESGWDNSQRWDEAIGLGENQEHISRTQIDEKKMGLFSKYKSLKWDLDKILSGLDFVVKPVDFNVLYVKNLECLAHLLQRLSEPTQANQYLNRAALAKDSIYRKMWDGDKYADLLATADGEKASAVKSAAMFFPMMLHDEPHSRQIIETHLTNPREFCPKQGYMVPTTSLDHAGFPSEPCDDPNDHYWRGNIWVIVNFFTKCAVERHLRRDPSHNSAEFISARIRESTFSLLDSADFFEYFHPLKYTDDEPTKGFGVPSFGWNGLATLMDRMPAFLAL